MTLQEIRKFLDACHEVSHIIATFPELPKGLSQRHMKAIQAIHDLQTSQNLSIGANAPEGCTPSCSLPCETELRVKISDVSDFLGGTRPSVTKLIRELEAHGALTKIPDTDDKRIIWLCLTPLGEQYYNFYCLQYHKWLGQVLCEIPQEDFETTIHTIYSVQEILYKNHPPKP